MARKATPPAPPPVRLNIDSAQLHRLLLAGFLALAAAEQKQSS